MSISLPFDCSFQKFIPRFRKVHFVYISTKVGIINSKSREEIYDKYEILPRSSKLAYRPLPHSSKQGDLFKARNDKIKLFA